MKNIPTEFRQKIREAKEKGLKSLDLRSLVASDVEEQLTYLPEELFALESLEELNLSYNSLISIPDSIARLRNLTSLNLSSNKLDTLPDSISQLQNLKSLKINSNPLPTIPEWITTLKNLEHLGLGVLKLKTVPDFIAQLERLKELILVGNELRIIPDWISNLKNLKLLWLRYNNLNTLPDSIVELRHLENLEIGSNAFSSIPDLVYELVSLKELSLGNYDYSTGNSIKEISPKILNLINLEELNLRSLPIEYPPPEVLNLDDNGFADIQKIRSYFRQLEAEGTDYLYEAKLLIVGEPGAGKSTLAKKIINPDYEIREDEKSTEGIEVSQWRFPMENGQSFRINIWDFGGQEIYHATHQFFLTKRSLYALVADTRKEDTDFYYWLNIVELLSDNSPLLIVKNEKQDRHREITERQLRGQFTNLKETIATNLATNRGLPQILNEIKHYVAGLPHIGTPLPRTWVKVREALENDARNHISLDEYLKICEPYGFTQNKDKLQLSGYLHDLGVCLHFQDDPLLKKTIILKPKWGTDAVYKVLDNKTVIGNFGKFNQADLAGIWNDEEYVNMQGELLRLMINFKLCYQIKGSDYYIAPELLTENQPDYTWDENDNLILRYTYDSFMPKGILTQFIVAMQTLISDQKLVWKLGVILKKDRTLAEVTESYGKREIKIRIAGKHKKELMIIVTYELDEIHDSYKRLKYTKLIPCNCTVCKNNQDPHFYSFGTLQRFFADAQHHIMCEKSYQMVNVLGLIDDVVLRPMIMNEAVEATKRWGGDFIFQQKVDTVVIQQSETGANIVRDGNKTLIRSAWANGSFYLFTFAVVITGLGVLANTVPFYTLAAVLVAGILFVPIIGALQLRQDDRLSEKSFIHLMKLVIGQLPLIGKFVRQRKEP
ncbi:MAG TPA: COR domain-containing protein [Pyrinomonadaceae bacterium]|jgi:small GTP-binding protein